MHRWRQHQGEENEMTLQECMRIQKLARALDELVAWNFVMCEEEMILAEAEKAVDVAQRELLHASEAMEFQRSRCALLPVDLRDTNVGRRQPHAARGEDSEINALWQAQGGALVRQYERHVTRYKRLWHELLQCPVADADSGKDSPAAAEGR